MLVNVTSQVTLSYHTLGQHRIANHGCGKTRAEAQMHRTHGFRADEAAIRVFLPIRASPVLCATLTNGELRIASCDTQPRNSQLALIG